MKLSEFQAQCLLQIAIRSLIIDMDFPIPYKERKDLVENIINQQSRELVELEKETSK